MRVTGAIPHNSFFHRCEKRTVLQHTISITTVLAGLGKRNDD
jgi:hypothetical protein